MIERGNTKHGPEQDQQLKHEAQGLVQGQGGPGHVEEWRQTEPLPDDTDSAEVQQALRIDGDLTDTPGDIASEPSPAAQDGASALTEGAAGLTADPVVLTTETPSGDGSSGEDRGSSDGGSGR